MNNTSIDHLRKVLSEITIDSCPNYANFHCHTTYSDGSLEAKELFSQAKNIGLTHLAITDHHNIDAFHQLSLSSSIPQQSNPFLWSGLEISSILSNCLVHILGLGVNVMAKEIKPYILNESAIGDSLSAVNVINSIHQAGGLAILAHPARYRLPFYLLIKEAHKLGIDGVEAWYDYDNGNPWKPSYLVCDEINNLAKELGLLSTCVTDTHGYSLKSR